MSAHAAEPGSVVPPMPERTPKALRRAIAQHTPKLIHEFAQHWKRAVADAYDVGPVPAFVAFCWGEYALARDPELDAHVHDLEHRAAYECTDSNEAKALLEEASKIRHRVQKLEPGE